jgi:hypothetical protein
MANYRRRSFQVEVEAWMNSTNSRVPQWVAGVTTRRQDNGALWIATRDGEVSARLGDWVLRDENGRVFTCAADMFDRLYEPLSAKSREPSQAVSMAS